MPQTTPAEYKDSIYPSWMEVENGKRVYYSANISSSNGQVYYISILKGGADTVITEQFQFRIHHDKIRLDSHVMPDVLNGAGAYIEAKADGRVTSVITIEDKTVTSPINGSEALDLQITDEQIDCAKAKILHAFKSDSRFLEPKAQAHLADLLTNSGLNIGPVIA
jgi:hypothetical protein